MPGFELVGKEEQEAVNEVFEKSAGVVFAHGFDALRNNIFRVRDLEKEFSKKVEAKYSQAVSSGSAALKVALKALGVQAGDEVITQSFTFVATVEAILEVGAIPVIVDIDKTLNMCPKSFQNAITTKTKAVIPVHMLGVTAQMDEIVSIARKNNILILEDTAQGLGGKFDGKHLGTIGDMGTYSFDGGKTVICGEGGMVVTNDESRFITARAYHDHGHEYSSTKGRGVEDALCSGFNYRMSELQAAFGLAQFKKLDYILKSQKENQIKLKNAISDIGFEFRVIPDEEGDIGDSIVFYLKTKEQAQKFAKKMGEAGLGTKNLPDAIKWHFAKHWQHMFQEYNFYNDGKNHWEKSDEILSRSIALPIMVKMTDEQIETIAKKTFRNSKRDLVENISDYTSKRRLKGNS
jgi:8-amino-3,8-dideoxy-alpha-D-manno-octulosonate transaminase